MGRLRQLLTFFKRHGFGDHLRNYAKVLLIWCPVVATLFIFGFGGHDHFLRRFSISYVISAIVATSCMTGSLFINFIYDCYLKSRGLEPRDRGLLWGVLTSYPFMLPGMFLGFKVAGVFSATIGHKWNGPEFSDYSSGIIFGILVSGLFLLFEVLRESRDMKQAAEIKFRTLENEKLKAQVSALTAQMNPHLLFNSLNTLASTITSDPKSAEDMVVQLSELYRGILKSAKGDVHTLENELLLCRSYLQIEKRRFGPRVDYKIFVEPSIDPKKVVIPALLLQPLIENAIKHGLAPKRTGGLVLIEIKKDKDDFLIRVTDNGVGAQNGVSAHFEKPSMGTNTGLSNCESRIKLKYGEESKFTFLRNKNSETVASIHIPLKAINHD